MLELLQARISLAKARVFETIDPDQANEYMINSYFEAKQIGLNKPELEPGALALTEPNLLEGFQSGVSDYYSLANAKNLNL